MAIPFTLYLAGDKVDDTGTPTYRRLTESGIGNIRIEGKALLATMGEDDEYTVAVSAGLSLPTGEAESRPYLSDKNFTGRIKAIGAADFGKLRAAANLGILLRETSYNFKTELGHQLLYGAAAAYPVERRVDLILEVFGRSGLNQFAELLLRRQPVRGQHRRPLHRQRDVVGHRRRRPRLRQRHRRARPAAVRHGRVRPRFPRPRQGRRVRRQRQVPG